MQFRKNRENAGTYVSQAMDGVYKAFKGSGYSAGARAMAAGLMLAGCATGASVLPGKNASYFNSTPLTLIDSKIPDIVFPVVYVYEDAAGLDKTPVIVYVKEEGACELDPNLVPQRVDRNKRPSGYRNGFVSASPLTKAALTRNGDVPCYTASVPGVQMYGWLLPSDQKPNTAAPKIPGRVAGTGGVVTDVPIQGRPPARKILLVPRMENVQSGGGAGGTGGGTGGGGVGGGGGSV